MSNLVLYSIPAFIVLVLLEVAWARKHPELRGYETKDTVASLSMGLINVGIAAREVCRPDPRAALEHRSRIPPRSGVAWLVSCSGLCYYWFHRLHHECAAVGRARQPPPSHRHCRPRCGPLLTPSHRPGFWFQLALVAFRGET